MIGNNVYQKFKRKEKLTYKEAIIAQCYICNGADEGGEDCNGRSCPLYQFMPYNPLKTTSTRRNYTEEEKNRVRERFKAHWRSLKKGENEV